MTYKRFLEIKDLVDNYSYNKYDEHNYLENKKFYQKDFNSKSISDFEYLVRELNCEGNIIRTQDSGIRNICCFSTFWNIYP